MLVGHDYAVNTDLSVLGVTSPGEPMAGEQHARQCTRGLPLTAAWSLAYQ
jgi:hypothetical protein